MKIKKSIFKTVILPTIGMILVLIAIGMILFQKSKTKNHTHFNKKIEQHHIQLIKDNSNNLHKQKPFYNKSKDTFSNTSNDTHINIIKEFFSMAPYYIKNYFHELLSHKKAYKVQKPFPEELWNECTSTNHDPNSQNITITPMGHATCLIQYQSLTFITDPVFFDIPYLARRRAPLTPSPENLPPIDFILISHNHPDHFDIKSLKLLYKKNPQAKVVVPLKMGKALKKEIGFTHIYECNWWDYVKVGKSIKLTCIPAQHCSQRGPFDKNKTLWSGWMVSIKDKNILFAGDTGYSEHFKNIKKEFGNINVALLPIMPESPQHIMEFNHLSPLSSIQAFIDLGMPTFIPIHWGVFALGKDNLKEQLKKFEDEICRLGYSKYLYGPSIGKPYKLSAH